MWCSETRPATARRPARVVRLLVARAHWLQVRASRPCVGAAAMSRSVCLSVPLSTCGPTLQNVTYENFVLYNVQQVLYLGPCRHHCRELCRRSRSTCSTHLRRPPTHQPHRPSSTSRLPTSPRSATRHACGGEAVLCAHWPDRARRASTSACQSRRATT